MEEEIIEELARKCKIKETEKTLIKVLINICKYYKIYESERIIKYIENIIKV